jgi:hypothetical protein
MPPLTADAATVAKMGGEGTAPQADGVDIDPAPRRDRVAGCERTNLEGSYPSPASTLSSAPTGPRASIMHLERDPKKRG